MLIEHVQQGGNKQLRLYSHMHEGKKTKKKHLIGDFFLFSYFPCLSFDADM